MSNATPDTLGRSITQVMEELETLSEQCSEGLLKIDELKEKLVEVERKLYKELPDGSTAHRILDRGKKEINPWWGESHTGYVERSHCEKILHWRQLVEKISENIRPVSFASEQGGQNQYFLEAGNVYRATKIILRILRRATKDLIIVDPYLDGSIFDYLDELNNNIQVKLITSNRKPIFSQLLHSRPSSSMPIVAAKECSESHDRFILIDGNDLWHLGASINHIGEKAAMLNRVKDQQQKLSALASIDKWWQIGVLI